MALMLALCMTGCVLHDCRPDGRLVFDVVEPGKASRPGGATIGFRCEVGR